MYLLKLSLRPWRRSPYSQVFTAVAVGVLLFLAGFLYWMQGSLHPVIDRLENEQVITAYLDPSLDTKDEPRVLGAVRDEIRVNLGAHAEVDLVQSDQFISHIRAEYPDLAHELEDLGSEMQTVIPRYISISGILPANTVGEIRQIQGIQSAESSTDRFQNVVGAFRALRWIATLLTLGLALALTTGLIHLGRTNAYLHQDASSLLSLMGASRGALRTPGLLAGFLVGTLGGACAAIAWTSVGISMTHHVRSLSPMLRYMTPSSTGFALALLVAGAVLGALSGVLGNFMGTTGHARGGRS